MDNKKGKIWDLEKAMGETMRILMRINRKNSRVPPEYKAFKFTFKDLFLSNIKGFSEVDWDWSRLTLEMLPLVD